MAIERFVETSYMQVTHRPSCRKNYNAITLVTILRIWANNVGFEVDRVSVLL